MLVPVNGVENEEFLDYCVCWALILSPGAGQSLGETLWSLRTASSHASGPGRG